MKIEIAESLFYSWLRHEKNCQIVQTNWSPSNYWDIYNIDDLKIVLENAKTHFKKTCDSDFFKQTASLEQFLKQAEVDVLGLHVNENGEQEIHLIDVAFHTGGLNYGGRKETVDRVIKKCIRSLLCALAYFRADVIKIIFASPVIINATRNDMAYAVKSINEFIKNLPLSCSVQILSDTDFQQQIVAPIVVKSNKIADSTELFVRSCQLLGKEMLKAPNPFPLPVPNPDPTPTPPIDPFGIMTKQKARLLCEKNGIYLCNNYTYASKNSGVDKYWANPVEKCINFKWHLVLNDTLNKKLYVFEIPRNAITHNKLAYRNDRELIDLQIYYNDMSFTDSRSRISFNKWLIKEIYY